MIYKSPCLWPVVCKKPLLSQVARNVVLGFCGVNSGRITYIFLIGWSSKRSSTPPTVSILGCYVMIFTMIGPDCNVEIARKNDMLYRYIQPLHTLTSLPEREAPQFDPQYPSVNPSTIDGEPMSGCFSTFRTDTQ